MTLPSPMERVHELIGFLEFSPTLEQIAGFMSNSIDPFGEVCGVGYGKLDSEGIIHIQFLTGFKKRLDYMSKVSISDHNPGAVALRTGQIQIFNFDAGSVPYRNFEQQRNLMDYRSGAALPLTNSLVMGFSFNTSHSDLLSHRDYLEVVRTVLAQYLAKSKLASSKGSQLEGELSSILTHRQASILDMIKEGRTNNSISSILGYSESLIRQETIIIYRKLGVEGRRELLRSPRIEEHSE